jgi:hypothetical protein
VFESLVGRFIMMEKKWTKQNNIDEVFMLYIMVSSTDLP